MKKFITKTICIAFMAMLCAWNLNAQSHYVALAISDSEGGAVFGDGVYEHGTEVTIVATPNIPYYEFINWTEGVDGEAIEVSTEPAYTFVVRGDHVFFANVEPTKTPFLELTLLSNPAEGGDVFGGGVYSYGENVTIKAAPHDGWTFVNWVDYQLNVVVSTEPECTIVMNNPRSLTANFTPIPGPFDIVLRCDPLESGTVSGGGTYPYGEIITVAAKANSSDYEFLYWELTAYSGAIVSWDPEYTFGVWNDRDLTAVFITSGKTVTVLTNMPEGEVVGGGVYHYGDEVRVEAIPHAGYLFVNWTTGRDILSTDNPYNFTVTEDVVLVANFEEDGVLPIEPIDGGAMMIYPNPTNVDMMVVLNNANLKIVEMELYDLVGRKVQQQTVNQSYGTLQLDGVAQGTYLLKIFLDKGEPIVWKVVKN